jgi:ABC-type dipeptide/oligopeptide/nickel transport systems, permease components
MQIAIPQRRFTTPRRLRGVAGALAVVTNSWTGLLGALGVATITAVSLLGPILVRSPYESDVAHIYEGPSLAHVLGTDFAGRDNLALVVYGGADILLLAFVTGVLTVALSAAIGATGAYFGGRVDTVLTGITDIWLTVPRFVLLIVIASIVKIDSTLALAALIAIFSWPALARLIRSQVLSLKRREFVEAARLLDLGALHIIAREMLPNMMAFIVVSVIGGMTQAIYAQTSLVFLGIVPLNNNWGVLFSLAYSRNAIYDAQAAWSLLAPIGAIILLQVSLVLLSRGLEEAFNPRLRTER